MWMSPLSGSSGLSDLTCNLGIIYKKETSDEIRSLGAVGGICLHYFDKYGVPIIDEEKDLMISMSLSQLKSCPQVIALAAGGREKIPALKETMAGGYIDVLITDRESLRTVYWVPETEAYLHQ